MWDDVEGLARKIAAIDARLKAVEVKLAKVEGVEIGLAQHHDGGSLPDDLAAVVHDLANDVLALKTHRPALFEPRKDPGQNPTS